MIGWRPNEAQFPEWLKSGNVTTSPKCNKTTTKSSNINAKTKNCPLLSLAKITETCCLPIDGRTACMKLPHFNQSLMPHLGR